MLVGADDPVRPQKNLFFTKISGEFDTSQGRTEASAPTSFLGTSGVFVGGDAHIAPAIRTVFTKIQCEFVTSLGSMCSIDPYELF